MWKSKSVISMVFFCLVLQFKLTWKDEQSCADSSCHSMYTFRLQIYQRVINSPRQATTAPPWSWDVGLDEFCVVVFFSCPRACDLAPVLLGHLIKGLGFASAAHKKHILSYRFRVCVRADEVWGSGHKQGGSAGTYLGAIHVTIR
jgi:hypothetical protein